MSETVQVKDFESFMENSSFFGTVTSSLPQTLSIIGLAKNTGKTTGLNHIIKQASTRKNIRPGISSTGWDGEAYDSITGKPKPKIILHANTIAATTDQCLKTCQAGYRIVEETNLQTSLGKIVIIEITSAGRLEIAGPSTLSDLLKIREKFRQLGCNLILFDGAINRKAASAPQICDGIILATGLNAGYNLHEVKLLTSFWVEIYSLPVWERFHLPVYGKNVLLDEQGHITAEINSRGDFEKKNFEGGKYFYLQGALFETLTEKILQNKNISGIITTDASKIFLNPQLLGKIKKQGVGLYVKTPTRIKAITVNPTSSSGNRMDSREFLEIMKKTCPKQPVWDIVYQP